MDSKTRTRSVKNQRGGGLSCQNYHANLFTNLNLLIKKTKVVENSDCRVGGKALRLGVMHVVVQKQDRG